MTTVCLATINGDRHADYVDFCEEKKVTFIFHFGVFFTWETYVLGRKFCLCVGSCKSWKTCYLFIHENSLSDSYHKLSRLILFIIFYLFFNTNYMWNTQQFKYFLSFYRNNPLILLLFYKHTFWANFTLLLIDILMINTILK